MTYLADLVGSIKNQPQAVSPPVVKKVQTTSPEAERYQLIRSVVHDKISTYFPTTLGQVTGVVDYFMNLIFIESSYEPWRLGVIVEPHTSKYARNYVNDPVFKKGVAEGVNIEFARQGLRGIGLGQCMGWYLVRGTGMGKEFMQSTYKNIAESHGIIVDIGTDFTTVFTNDKTGIERGVVSGLIVLASKFKIYRNINPSHSLAFNFEKALQSYLGDKFSRDVLGTDPSTYAQSILTGKALSGKGIPKYASTSIASGSIIATSNSSQVKTPARGC